MGQPLVTMSELMELKERNKKDNLKRIREERNREEERKIYGGRPVRIITRDNSTGKTSDITTIYCDRP